MTKESMQALINQVGKEKLIRINVNNNLVENVYGEFDPDKQIVNISGTDFVVFNHTLPARYNDGKDEITSKKYIPIFAIEGLVFIDDAERLPDVDKWMVDRM